jgi:hypothetical protein
MTKETALARFRQWFALRSCVCQDQDSIQNNLTSDLICTRLPAASNAWIISTDGKQVNRLLLIDDARGTFLIGNGNAIRVSGNDHERNVFPFYDAYLDLKKGPLTIPGTVSTAIEGAKAAAYTLLH